MGNNSLFSQTSQLFEFNMKMKMNEVNKQVIKDDIIPNKILFIIYTITCKSTFDRYNIHGTTDQPALD